MNRIFEIDNQIAELLNGAVNEETGELELNVEEIEQLGIERDEIVEYLCLQSKEDQAFIDALKNEIDSLSERMKKHENRMNSRNEYIKYITKGQKFETPKVSVTFRTSKDVVCFDIKESEFKNFAIDNKLYDILNEKTSYTVSKTAIKDALQNGKKIPHAYLQDSVSMTLK